MTCTNLARSKTTGQCESFEHLDDQMVKYLCICLFVFVYLCICICVYFVLESCFGSKSTGQCESFEHLDDQMVKWAVKMGLASSTHTNTFCNLIQIHFAIRDKYILQFKTNTFKEHRSV